MVSETENRKRKWGVGLLLILLFTAGFIVIAVRLEKNLKPFLIKSLNEKLAVPVFVGDVEFSFLRNFPSATLVLRDVTVMPAFKNKYDTLLKAEAVSVIIQWQEIFAETVTIRKIAVENGKLNLHIRPDGQENYNILKTDSTSSGNLDLEKIILHKIQMRFTDERNSRQLNTDIDNAEIKAFISETLKIKTRADLTQPVLSINDIVYLNKQNTRIDLEFNYDSRLKRYAFQQSQIMVNDLKLQLKGIIEETINGTDYDLTVSSGKAGLKALIALIPEKYSARWKDYKINGEASFQMMIKGRQQGKQQPLYLINFRVVNGSIKTSHPETELSQIRLTGEFASQSVKNKSDRLELKDISALLNGKPVNGSLEITHMADPFIKAHFNSEATLENISRFYLPEFLESMSGEMIIRNAAFTGRLADPKTHTSSGTISILNASVAFREKPVTISNVEASLKLEKDLLTVYHLSGNARQSDFAFSGAFKNLLGYLWNGSVLNMNGSLQSSMLDFNEILAKEKSTSEDTIYKIQFSDNFSFQLKLKVDQTRFNQFHAQDITGTVSLKNKSFNAEQVAFKTMNGHAIISGFISETANDSLTIAADARLQQINIREMFYQLGNFGQEVITDKHLNGVITATLKFSSPWSKTLVCRTNGITAWSDLTIENGELAGFAPMMALSKYLKGSDLNHIRFSTLKNTIEIKSRQVIIPQMEIKSSAADVTLAGTHSFDNIIDYRVQLLLSQLTGKKVKSLNTEFGQIEEDNLGRTKLLLRLTGPAANPKISYDTKAVKEKVISEIKKESQTIKELLRKEFGKNKEEQQRIPEKQKELQIEED
jgi:hypothetical protein